MDTRIGRQNFSGSQFLVLPRSGVRAWQFMPSEPMPPWVVPFIVFCSFIERGRVELPKPHFSRYGDIRQSGMGGILVPPLAWFVDWGPLHPVQRVEMYTDTEFRALFEFPAEEHLDGVRAKV